MIELYQRTSAHLAHVRTRYDDVGLNARLSFIVGCEARVVFERAGFSWLGSAEP